MEYGPYERREPGRPANATELDRLAQLPPGEALGRSRTPEASPGGLHDPESPRKGGLLSPTMETRNVQRMETNYASDLGRLAAAKAAAGQEGFNAELAQIPDRQLGETAQMADARIRRGLQEGDLQVDEKGDLGGNYLDDAPARGEGLLDVVNEFRRRSGQNY